MNQGESPALTPLLKWPGGKRALLHDLMQIVPDEYGRYYEPFFGGGALFFALRPTRAVLGDHNAELVECYAEIRDNPQNVLAGLRRLKNCKENYYRVRELKPRTPATRAARLIYLITLSFNGIYRVNLRGEFNVPYGHKTHLKPFQPENILAASKALARAELLCGDFSHTVADAKAGDFVYLDPPYTVAHGNNGFVKYNARIFSWDDQVRLRDLALLLAKRGCHVVISNAKHQSLLDLYEGFQHKIVSRPSIIAASSEYRGRVTECIFHKGCE